MDLLLWGVLPYLVALVLVAGLAWRYRYDQLMRLGWKIFLPLSLIFVVLISGWIMLTRYGVQP